MADSCRRHGITEQSYYWWRRRKAEGADETVERLRELSVEVERLKQILAEVMLDNRMLREVAQKVVTSLQQRAATAHLRKKFKVSQRRAARALGSNRSTVRYGAKTRDAEAKRVAAIRKLARRHPRYGYRRIHARLVATGWSASRKRVCRL